jgi:hypothetical protein
MDVLVLKGTSRSVPIVFLRTGFAMALVIAD